MVNFGAGSFGGVAFGKKMWLRLFREEIIEEDYYK